MPAGSCLCGDIAWEIDGPFDWMAHCHCTMCRKAHGSAYATFVTFPGESLRWLRGAEGMRRFASSPGSLRAFCGRCGSKVPALEPFAYAFAGPMTGDFGIAPTSHLFVACKAPWHDISDDLTRHDALAGPGVAMATPRHTEPAPPKVRGSCLCGRVAYELDGPLAGGAIVSCHCERCRKARAAAHASNLFVDSALFTWLRGETGLCSYKVPEAERFAQSFCGDCGSPMPARATVPGRKMIPCGSLDDDPGVREGLHIFVASKAPWHAITGALPQYAAYPPEGFPPIARRAHSEHPA